MEQMEQHSNNSNTGYWPSVGIASFIFGMVYFIVSIIGGYIGINSEPTGSLFGGTQMIFGVIACLFTAFGGLLAVWHYVNEFDISLSLGSGALIGLWTGIGIAVVMTLLSQIWELFDPSYTEKVMNSMIANYEAIEGLPEEQKQQMIDAIYSQFQDANTLWGIIKGTIFIAMPTGILNLLTGMLGVKFFSKEND